MVEAGGLICGVDEAGRGPLAGPVFAAAVILPQGSCIHGLNDSKALTARRRNELEIVIRGCAVAWSIAEASVQEIDELNILQASLLAMKRAVINLTRTPSRVLVDGLYCPQVACDVEAIVRGDSTVPAISAASILAKTARDREMLKLDEQFPQYGFAQHKGYPTAHHLRALSLHGACAMHRRSFAPVRKALMQMKAV